MAWRSYVDPGDGQVYWTDGEPGDADANYLSDADYKAGPGRATGGGSRGGATAGDISDMVRAIAESNQLDLDEKRYEFDRLMNWYREQLKMTQDFDEARFAREYELKVRQFNEDIKRFAVNTGMDLAKLGASLKGPDNPLTYAAYTSQAKDIYGMASGGTPGAAFGAPSGYSQPSTIQSLLDQLGIRSPDGGFGGQMPVPIYQPKQPDMSDAEAFDWIWQRRPDLKEFFDKNGWKTDTPEEQRAAVWHWLNKVSQDWRGMTPQQVATALGYKPSVPGAGADDVLPEKGGRGGSLPGPFAQGGREMFGQPRQPSYTQGYGSASQPPDWRRTIIDNTRPRQAAPQTTPGDNVAAGNIPSYNTGKPVYGGAKDFSSSFQRNNPPGQPGYNADRPNLVPAPPGYGRGQPMPPGNRLFYGDPIEPGYNFDRPGYNVPAPPGYGVRQPMPPVNRPYRGHRIVEPGYNVGPAMPPVNRPYYGDPTDPMFNQPPPNMDPGIWNALGPTARQLFRDKGYLVENPHQINPAVWDSMNSYGRGAVLNAAELGYTPSGAWDRETFLSQLNAARPKGTAPKRMSYNYGNRSLF